MGCCFSRSDGPNSPYPGGGHSSSARAINTSGAAATSPSLGPMTGAAPSDGAGSPRATASVPRLRAASVSAEAASATSGSAPRWSQPALAQHINKPLRRRRWASRNRAWTRRAIDQERTDFFDTRVTGRPEIWQTLHAALELLWEADRQAADSSTPGSSASDALATAQSMVDAADITLPTGDLAQGAYDALGSFYALPAWIVSDPTNLDPDPAHDPEDLKGTLDDVDDTADDADDADDSDDSDDDDALNDSDSDRASQPSLQRRRRAEKGKAVAIVDDQIAVRARLSATSRDVVVYCGRHEPVRSLVHRILEEGKLPQKTRIRIAYLGKILKDGTSLEAQGWKEGHVVNALVFEPA